MICSTGGFPIIHHNEVCNLTVQLLTELCSSVSVEPPLQPLGEETFTHHSVNVEDFARADLKHRDFVSTTECLF